MSDSTTTTNDAPAPAQTPAPMLVFARIQDRKVAELISSRLDPSEQFHADLVWIRVDTISPLPQPGWAYDGTKFTAPAPYVAPNKSVFTPLEFMGRLTEDEDTAITAAAQQSTKIMLWLFSSAAANDIDLKDPRTIAGINALVAAGLLTPARATEILTP